MPRKQADQELKAAVTANGLLDCGALRSVVLIAASWALAFSTPLSAWNGDSAIASRTVVSNPSDIFAVKGRSGLVLP